MSFLNIAQEKAFSRYGKHFQESMFYQHVLGLPRFVLSWTDILAHAQTWNARWEPLPLALPINMAVPTMWLMLLLNMFCH